MICYCSKYDVLFFSISYKFVSHHIEKKIPVVIVAIFLEILILFLNIYPNYSIYKWILFIVEQWYTFSLIGKYKQEIK